MFPSVSLRLISPKTLNKPINPFLSLHSLPKNFHKSLVFDIAVSEQWRPGMSHISKQTVLNNKHIVQFSGLPLNPEATQALWRLVIQGADKTAGKIEQESHTLISNGADIYAVSPDSGKSLLHFAAQFLSVEQFRSFLYVMKSRHDFNIEQNGDLMDVNPILERRDKKGRSVLHLIAEDKYKDEEKITEGINKVYALLDASAPIDAKDSMGHTPLMLAALSGNKRLVEVLIFKEADKNARRGDGSTLLMHAVLSGNERLVEMLIDQGAEINARDNLQRSPLHYVVFWTKSQLKEFLFSIGVAPDSDVSDSNSLFGVFTSLVSQPKTQLDNLIESLIKVATVLLQKGADVNAKDEKGLTPLYHAVANGYDEAFVKLLIKNGAKVIDENGHEIQRNGGKTIRKLAAKYNNEGISQILEEKYIEDMHKYHEQTRITSLSRPSPFSHPSHIPATSSDGKSASEWTLLSLFGQRPKPSQD